MKVFFYSRGYPTSEYKMNGIFEMDQALALKEAGIDVVFLSLDLRSIRRKRKFGYREFSYQGLPVYSLDLPLGNIPKNLFYKLGTWGLSYLYDKAVEKEGAPDIVNTLFTDQGYMMVRALEGKGPALILIEANSHVNKDQVDEKLRKAAAYTYPRLDQFITVSPAFQSKIKKDFGQDSKVLTVIPNLDIFTYNERPMDRQGFSFVSTGRTTVAKGMEDLVKAFMMAFDKEDKVTIDIFGDGADRKALENLVIREGYQDKIKFWGMTHREDIAKRYKEADAFVMLSHSETFGLAYLEALATGLPVIATRCGGPEHLITKDNGVLVDVKDIEAQAQAMKVMKENIESYNKKEISSHARTTYSARAITQDLIEIYKEVLNA